MPRPNSFWDVLSETANYAGEAIPAAQEQNRRTAMERERFGLRAQQEQEKFGETKRYHNEMIGLRRNELDFQKQKYAHPAEDPTFEKVLLRMAQHPEEFTPQSIKDFKEHAAEYYNMKRPEPQPKEWQQPPDAPNFIQEIGEDYDRRMNTYSIQAERAKRSGLDAPTVPTMLGSVNRRKGEFSRKYKGFENGVNRDSIAAGVGIEPYELNTVDSLPPMNPGGLRSQARPAAPQQSQTGPNRQELEANKATMAPDKYAKWDAYLRSQGQ